MIAYKFKELENGDILLEKTIFNESNYTIIQEDNGDILLKKATHVNITDIKKIKDYWKANIVLDV
jgi:hypothetical protein